VIRQNEDNNEPIKQDNNWRDNRIRDRPAVYFLLDEVKIDCHSRPEYGRNCEN
jgi:hypothetical protein